ncbi:MAG: OmpA family protein, partial [Bacteroidales bacterium]|nr:OmpA family protein [Bacteroidales bacterium]
GWFFDIKAGGTYTAGEAQKFINNVTAPTIAVGAGYDFVPGFQLRGELSGWQAKGTVLDGYAREEGNNGEFHYKFNYVQFNVDAVWDICNSFKYKSKRLFSPYIFAGPGLNYRFNNAQALEIAEHFPTENYLWETGTLMFTGRAGAGVAIRLTDAIKLEVELVDNILSDKFNSKKNDRDVLYIGKLPLDFDYNISALVGVKFAFGQAAKRKAAETAAAAAAAEAAAAKAAADKAAADKAAAEKAAAEKAAAEKAAAEKAAAEKAAAEAAAAKAAAERAAARSASENVLFVIGRTEIRKSEVQKIQNIVDVLNAYPEATVSVTGYADKDTGTHSGNWILSEKRANNVANAIKKAGIAADRITVDFKGDTEKVSPVPAENRVAVMVTR